MTAQAVIDTHLHLWNPEQLDYEWLSYVPTIAGPHGTAQWTAQNIDITGAVFVQSDCAPQQALAEIEWVSGLAKNIPVLGIVAYAPLEAGEGVTKHIVAMTANPLVRGVRRSVQNEPDGFMDDTYLEGLIIAAEAGLSIDMCARDHQLPRLSEILKRLLDRVPGAVIIMDHLGKPDIKAHGQNIHAVGWATSMRALAALPNVFVKISGLTTQADWDHWRPETLRPYIDFAIDVFGPERCLFGGDWPVVDLAGGYARWRAVFDEALSGLTPQAQAHIRCDTARRVYRL